MMVSINRDIVRLNASLLSEYELKALADIRAILESNGWYKYREHRDLVTMDYEVVMHRPVHFAEIEAILEGGPDENL